MKTRVVRYDEKYGRTGGVRASCVFPPLSAYTPGVRVVVDEDPRLTGLYEQLGQLMARPDALDPDSDTARMIAEVDRELSELEHAEADRLAADFEARLLMPMDTGVNAADEFDRLIATYADPPADHSSK